LLTARSPSASALAVRVTGGFGARDARANGFAKVLPPPVSRCGRHYKTGALPIGHLMHPCDAGSPGRHPCAIRIPATIRESTALTNRSGPRVNFNARKA
jgi:hypothetical protein